MNDAQLETLDQVRDFLAGTALVAFNSAGDDACRYRFVSAVLSRFGYCRLGKPDKGLLRVYLMRTTGYSRAQVARLVRRFQREGGLSQHYAKPKAGFRARFTDADVALLAEVDSLHGTLSGPTTRVLLQRACETYGDARFQRLATISVAHLYNLRKRTDYQKVRRHWTKTRPTTVPIGVRKPPSPQGRPGYIRIDSVHQGDQDGVKGIYHVNAVDSVTQWQLVATCERISENFMLPVIQLLLEGFPFPVHGIHADNGSEYINYKVAKMLEKLRVELTKSRPRHSNDNALVESKNGAVVRKILGYSHIPQRFATQVNAFCSEHLNPYVNFHRPCILCRRNHRRQWQTTKALSPRSDHDALRKAPVPASQESPAQTRTLPTRP